MWAGWEHFEGFLQILHSALWEKYSVDIANELKHTLYSNYKANESQFIVSRYTIFHDCVGDHFIFHYSLFYTISLLHLLQV